MFPLLFRHTPSNAESPPTLIPVFGYDSVRSRAGPNPGRQTLMTFVNQIKPPRYTRSAALQDGVQVKLKSNPFPPSS